MTSPDLSPDDLRTLLRMTLAENRRLAESARPPPPMSPDLRRQITQLLVSIRARGDTQGLLSRVQKIESMMREVTT